MNKTGFLKELRASLTALSDRERDEALAYYDEWIDERMQDSACSQEEAIEYLGSPASIAAGIMETRESAGDDSSVRMREDQGMRELSAGADEARHILIRTKNTRLTIRPSAGNELKLRYSEDEYHSYDCVLEDGRLSLELRPQDRLGVFGFRLFSSPGHTIELIVPKDFAAAIDAQSSNASMSADKVTLWGALRLRTNNARVETADLSAKEIDIRSSNGKLIAHRLRSDSAMSLHTGNGRIEVRDLSCKGPLTLETSNARVKAEQLHSDESIRVHSSNGPLHIEHAHADRLSFLTSNASISGMLPGRAEEYTVQSGTSKDKNSLKDHPFNGPKQLEARTSNGSIKLTFEG